LGVVAKLLQKLDEALFVWLPQEGNVFTVSLELLGERPIGCFTLGR